ncbi:MAG: hypothetical protein HYR60_23365, partial [Acidobacteria bacterium]|nr:hypothetical protein [Acidobacteriota bacterium]
MRVVCLILAVCLPAAAGPSASQFYRQGRQAERSGEMARAYLLYSQAAALAPNKKSYWLRSQAVRSRAALQAKVTPGAEALDDGAGAEPPDAVTDGDLREARKPQPPKELQALPVLRDFALKADAKQLFEQVAKAYGLEVVFDGDYQAGIPIPFRMDQADYRQALHALQNVTGSFAVPLGERLLFVAKDTQQKRNESEPTVAVAVSIPQPVSVQEATELARSVQQLMEIKRFAVDNTRRLVVMSDRISKVRPAQQVFEELLYYRPEVRVDLEFLEVDRTDTLAVGLDLPTSFALRALSPHSPLPSLPGYLLKLGAGSTLFGIGISDATLVASMSQSNARSLLRVHLRSTDGQAATFHVGDKYPVLTGGYFGGVDSNNPSAYRPPPQFTFEDLGLVVKVTPKINGREEVSLNVEAEFKVLAGQALNGIPVISNR